MNINRNSTIFAWSLHSWKSVLAKPVVVVMDTTWKAPWRTASITPLPSRTRNIVTAAVAISTTAAYARNSSS
jgi:hypothetical protein